MSDDKQDKIKKLLEMQKKFIALDRKQGVEASEYFSPSDDSEMSGFKEEFRDLAMDIVDLAHEEKGSKK
jgi:soluble cytochrome b562